jgi:hypothetical protein
MVQHADASGYVAVIILKRQRTPLDRSVAAPERALPSSLMDEELGTTVPLNALLTAGL